MATLGDRLKVASRAVVGIFSDSAARAAYGLLAGIYPGQQGQPPPKGTREYLLAYSQMPWLRAVTSRIAAMVATAEWQLYVNKRKGEPAQLNRRVQVAKGVERRKMLKQLADAGELQQLETHPMLDVLTDANSFQTGDQMRKVTQIHLDLVGEGFWLKERGPLGTPVGVWPIPPDWIANTPTPASPFYRVAFKGWRGLIPDTEFVWFVDPDPSNPYGRGSGTARSLSDELETDEYAAKHTKAWFYNRARPDLIVYPKQGSGMREGDVKRLETDWVNNNRGFWRSFKPYFLTREVGVHELDQDFRAMQLVQLREYERDTILQVFGVPPEILGVLSNSNRATITAADLVMARYVVEPRLELMRSVLQERLAPEYDERLIVEFASPVQQDKDYELDVLKGAPQVASVDEWRELAGLPPMKDDAGRVHFVPTGYRPLDPEGPDGLMAEPSPPADPFGLGDENVASTEEDGGPPARPKPPGNGNSSSTSDDQPPKGRTLWRTVGLQ